MRISTYIKLFLISLTVVMFTGCSNDSGDKYTPTAQEIAINKIKAYAATGEIAPTLQDYTDVGVVGVTEDNLANVNEVVENLTPEEVDTVEKIQAVVDDAGAVAPNPPAPTPPDQPQGETPKAGDVPLQPEECCDNPPAPPATCCEAPPKPPASAPPAPNKPPVADAGGPYEIGICDAMVLDGSASFDLDGTIVTHAWSASDGTPLGSGQTLPLPVVGRTPGDHIITLTVTDNKGATDTDTVTVTINGADGDYDFSYIITDPNLHPASPYLTENPSNAHTFTEPTFHFWVTTTTNSDANTPADPGIVDFDFTFPGNIEIAYLQTRITTFHFPYSSGSAYFYVSKDGGAPWVQLLYADTPPINGFNIQRYNGFLDDSFVGNSTLSTRAELHADGSSYPRTAQFLRWQSGETTFKLNVCYEGGQAPH